MCVNVTLFLDIIDCNSISPSSSLISRYFIDVMLLINQINRLPPEVVKYFTDPNAVEAPDMELLFPFVDSALPLAYGVLGVLLFHVSLNLHCNFGIYLYNCNKRHFLLVYFP